MWRLLLCLIVCSVPCAVFAEDRGKGEDEGHHHVAAVRTVGVVAVTEGKDPAFLLGPGALIERSIFHHQLEVELSAAVLFGHGETIPVDLLIKKPFHLTPTVDLYVGAGPAIVFVFPENDVGGAYPGGMATFGSYLWLFGDVGLQVELDYAVVFEEHVVHEFETALGMVFRF